MLNQENLTRVLNCKWIWFIITLMIFLLLDPFQLPLWKDRAYLMYMSQTVYRGLDLYEYTPFGYTPLAPLVAGYSLRIVEAIVGDVDTILTLRGFGMILQALIVVSIFQLSHQLFKSIRIAHLTCICFLSFNVFLTISATNFEPKFLALLLQIWAIQAVINKRLLRSGTLFSMAAMCWHLMVINCLIMVPYLFIVGGNNKQTLFQFFRFSAGVLLGTLPCLVYLYVTDDWLYFWNQAVVRKVEFEGTELFDSPLAWILVLMNRLTAELLILIFGAIGFVVTMLSLVFGKWSSLWPRFDGQSMPLLFVLITVAWTAFNSIEFQGPLDFLPLLPIVVLFGMVPIVKWIERATIKQYIAVLMVAVFTGFFDYGFVHEKMTLDEQKQMMADLNQRYGDAFVINFEEFYVLQEKPLPTRYMRMARFEDFVINKKEINGCESLIDQVRADRPKVIILRRVKENKPSSIGKCGQQILDTYAYGEKSSFQVTSTVMKSFSKRKRIVTYDIFGTIFSDQISQESRFEKHEM